MKYSSKEINKMFPGDWARWGDPGSRFEEYELENDEFSISYWVHDNIWILHDLNNGHEATSLEEVVKFYKKCFKLENFR